jgi:hypothetical protein
MHALLQLLNRVFMPSTITALLPSRFLWCSLFISLLSNCVKAQSDSSQQKVIASFNQISEKALDNIRNKYSLLQRLIERKTEKMLSRMQSKEAELQQQMQGQDSVKAKQLFADAQAKYRQLAAKLAQPPFAGGINAYKQYLPGLDSTQTSFQFLAQKGANIPGIPVDKLQKIEAISQQLQQLQSKWQVAGEAQTYISQREQQLKQQLMNSGLSRQLLGMNKEAYYYQQQLTEYKSMINDKEKMEETALAAVRQVPAFQPFWQKYSMLAQLFPPPPGLGSTEALNGLQTRSGTESLLKGSAGSVGPDPQYVQQQIEKAQSTLNTLKNKVSSLGGTSGSGDMVMPDFEPNPQHTKSFLKRLEYGFNIQNTGQTNLLPSTSNFAVTLGYKLSSKATAGIGISYLMGWGNGLNHVSLSNQGVGLRSYMDVKLKGSLWISGGLEYTYYQVFAKLADIRNLDVWQKSALIGLTKKVTVRKITANLQLLYDLLNQVEVPKGQAFVFRVGYSL